MIQPGWRSDFRASRFLIAAAIQLLPARIPQKWGCFATEYAQLAASPFTRAGL
jgi:hypothetical protein